MKKNFKLMLVALFTLLSGSVMAAPLEGTTQYNGGGLQYHIISLDKTTKVYTVSVSQSDWATQATDKTALTIPAEVKFPLKGEDHNGAAVDEEITFKVVEIEANGFKGLSDITTISFGLNSDGKSNITTIGAGAFEGTKIKILDLRKTQITVLNKLFEYNNVELNEVYMPTTIVSLADMALADCIQLNKVDFKDCTKLTTLGAGSLSNTIVSEYDFKDCINATAPTSVLNFADGVNPFVNSLTTTNKNLTKVTLPVSLPAAAPTLGVTVIGTVFANCEKLKDIKNLDKTLITTVGANAFANDINLESLSFPKTLTSVAGTAATDQPFVGCKKLKTLTFDGSGTTALVLGDGTNDLFGDYKYKGVAFDPVLENLYITVPATTPLTSTAVEIKKDAFVGNGETSVLKKVEIAKGGVFAGKIEATAIVLATAANAEVEFGNIGAATIATITGPKGVYKTQLTIGEWNPTAALTTAIVDGVLSEVNVKEVKEQSFVVAAGNAEVINFKAEISAKQTAPAANALAALTTINFGGADAGTGIKIGAGMIDEAVFDETKAPNLKEVTWKPADANAVAAFHKKAFGTAAKGANAKVTLYTSTKVCYTVYGNDEGNLFNVIFVAEEAPAVATPIPVYGTAASTYFYGKFKAVGSNFAIAKETVDNPATEDVDESGAQVVVYSAFVDESDKKLYMDPLAIKDGNYIVKQNQVVIVRVKDPKKVDDMTNPEGGKQASINAYSTLDPYTMRITPYGGYAVVNDLKMNDILFSSDFIGTNYIGKTLFAMVNPAKAGVLDFKPVSPTQYLPAGSVFVEKNEASAANLSIVWLDGADDSEVTGIINKMAEKTQDGVIYNLQGVRVNGAQKGVYIQNGKKFIVK